MVVAELPVCRDSESSERSAAEVRTAVFPPVAHASGSPPIDRDTGERNRRHERFEAWKQLRHSPPVKQLLHFVLEPNLPRGMMQSEVIEILGWSSKPKSGARSVSICGIRCDGKRGILMKLERGDW